MRTTERFGYVRLYISETGEVMEFKVAGTERNDDWRDSSLQVALRLVPSLVDAIDGARMRRRCVDVKVSDGPEAETT